MSTSHDEWLAAAQRGDADALRRLLGGDATLLVSTRGASSHGHSALHHAASKNHAAAVAFLLEAGADASAQNHGSTALHTAAANGHADVARVLVRTRPPPRATPTATRRQFAAARGHDAALQLTLHSPKHAYSSPQGARGAARLRARRGGRAARLRQFCGARDGFKALCYRGSTFHRLLPGQALQGGRLGGGGAPRSTLARSRTNARRWRSRRSARLLCMANSGPDTNGTQFFITLAPTPYLQACHVCFGRLVAGDDALQQLGGVPAGADDRPVAPITVRACGRWPPPPPRAAEAAAAAEPELVTAAELATAAATRDGVTSAIAQASRRATRPKRRPPPRRRRLPAASRPRLGGGFDALAGLCDEEESDEEEEAENVGESRASRWQSRSRRRRRSRGCGSPPRAA